METGLDELFDGLVGAGDEIDGRCLGVRRVCEARVALQRLVLELDVQILAAVERVTHHDARLARQGHNKRKNLCQVQPCGHHEKAKRKMRQNHQHNTTQDNTTQHNTTQHNTTQHNTTKHNTTPHNTTHHNTTQHNTTNHNTTQHNTTQHNTTQEDTKRKKKMETKDVNLFVLQYMARRGYHGLDMLKSELKELSDDVTTQQQLQQRIGDVHNSNSILNFLLFHVTEDSSAAYKRSYSALREWIHQSLDLYRVIPLNSLSLSLSLLNSLSLS